MEERSNFPLFIISDCSTVFEQDIFEILTKKDKKYVLLHGGEFCNIAINPHHYRREWLALCKELSKQLKCAIVFEAAVTPDMFEHLEKNDFSETYWLAIVSNEETVLNRLQNANITDVDRIKGAVRGTHWMQESARFAYPEMIQLDISQMTAENIANFVENWISERI